MSDFEMAAVWLALAVVVTLLGMYAGFRMGRARNEWERRRFEKIEEENRSLRRELSVARVKADGAARLFEVTDSDAVSVAAEPQPPVVTEPIPDAKPVVNPVLDLRKLTQADIEDVVIDLTDGATQHDAGEVARLETLLMREIDLMLADADS